MRSNLTSYFGLNETVFGHIHSRHDTIQPHSTYIVQIVTKCEENITRKANKIEMFWLSCQVRQSVILRRTAHTLTHFETQFLIKYLDMHGYVGDFDLYACARAIKTSGDGSISTSTTTAVTAAVASTDLTTDCCSKFFYVYAYTSKLMRNKEICGNFDTKTKLERKISRADE